MIAITADFDPVHKGHEKLIKEGKKLADEKSSSLVVYLNKGFSANHAPFFVDYEARKEMALALGADEVRPFENLHHRLILSYSVPIRLSKMINEGVTDYITAADISIDEIAKKANKFIQEGKFVGMPQNYPNRNEIRWYAINKFLGSKLDFHVIEQVKDGGKISGRAIRQSILDNGLTISKDVRKVIPKTTAEILEREIAMDKIPGVRNYKEIYKTLNTTSRANLTKLAYLNGNSINEIIKKRVYRDSQTIWAAFRKADYGPVMTRLATSAVEENVTKKEVFDLMKHYESLGVIPKEQSVKRVIDRAFYVASEVEKGKSAREANETFRSQSIEIDSPLTIYAGLNLTKFETKIMKENLNADIYVDKNNKLACEIKSEGKKIKTNLKLHSRDVTYLRYIIDSNFIPITGTSQKVKNSYKVKFDIGS